jgi:hypothetical protein
MHAFCAAVEYNRIKCKSPRRCSNRFELANILRCWNFCRCGIEVHHKKRLGVDFTIDALH